MGQLEEVKVDDTWPRMGEMRNFWKGTTERHEMHASYRTLNARVPSVPTATQVSRHQRKMKECLGEECEG